jgi:hypothetical protein
MGGRSSQSQDGVPGSFKDDHSRGECGHIQTGLCLGRWTNIGPCLAPLSRPDRKKLLHLVDIDSDDFITTVETLGVNFGRGNATPEVSSRELN